MTAFQEGRVEEIPELPALARARFGAHWHMFVPTTVIAILYFCAWAGLYLLNGGTTSLSRLFMVVLAVGVPLLLAHAFIRYQTIYLEIYENELHLHPGWPRVEPIVLPYGVVRNVRVRRGLSGRVFGGGSLFVDLVSGETVVLADIGAPEKARAAVDEAISEAVKENQAVGHL